MTSGPAFPSDDELVPPLGRTDKYFLGGGRAAAATSANDAIWTFLVGPCYSSPNFLRREELSLSVDGGDQLLDLRMRRVRRSGMFAGTRRSGDLDVRLVDFAPFDAPWVARILLVANRSAERSTAFRIGAVLEPTTGNVTIEDGSRVSILQDTTTQLFSWIYNDSVPQNWADRFADIGFDVPATACRREDGTFRIDTEEIVLAPGEVRTVTLVHAFAFRSDRTPGFHEAIRALDVAAEMTRSRAEWASWLDEGAPLPSRDPRTVDLLEGMLISIRTARSYDGGFMACPHCYSFSYFRDTHGGLRGLAASGRHREIRAFLLWTHDKFLRFGHIPNAAEMGGSHSVLNLGIRLENLASESPAYFVKLVETYLDLTGDRAFLDRIEASFRYAVDIQLSTAEGNDWNLRFHGDETEQYVPSVDGAMYGTIPDWDRNAFCMASVAMAIASAQFMVRYQTEIGRPEAAEEYQRKLDRLRDGLDRHYWQPEKGRHAWTLLPDGRPSGHDVVNFLLLPLWFGARLEKERETDDARAVLAYMDRETFRLPMVPGENHGFSGHTPAYLLHALTTLGHEDRHRVYRSIVDSLLVDEWGTVSEFYGPHDTSNGHSFNLYSTGITLDALWKYLAEGDPSHGDPT